MERDSRRDQRAVDTYCRLLACQKGQSSVEYAIVVAAFLSVALGFAAFLRALSNGVFSDVFLLCSSHRLLEGIIDVLAF